MKKTFKLLAFALVASLVALTSCNTDDDENNPSTPPVEQPELSYTFEDIASWTPQTVEFGYDTTYIDYIYAGGYISQNNMSFYEANEIIGNDPIAGYEQLKNSFILMFSGEPGDQIWEMELIGGVPVLDNGVMYIQGTTQLMGETIPLIWLSENMTISVTKFDIANQKLSFTLTATMRDMINLMMGASGSDQGAKTFTLSVKNYPMSDWGIEELKKLATKMKKLK
jgi:hypothetical protein